jgi:hypothetical protein
VSATRRCRPRRGRRDTSARSPGAHDVQAPDAPGRVSSAFRVLAHEPLPVSDSLVRTLGLEPSRCQSSYGALDRGWSRRAVSKGNSVALAGDQPLPPTGVLAQSDISTSRLRVGTGAVDTKGGTSRRLLPVCCPDILRAPVP